MRIAVLAAALLAMVAGSAQAAVTSVGANGFELEQSVRVGAPPDRVWAAVIKPGGWWNPEHSYSSNAANMTISPVAGGCWCETWAGGSAVHMIVVFVTPGKVLRMHGGLGPMQQMGVEGAMTWKLTAMTDGATLVTLNMAVGGYSREGFENLSKGVDGVLTEQLGRLQRFVQTGNANAQATQ